VAALKFNCRRGQVEPCSKGEYANCGKMTTPGLRAASPGHDTWLAFGTVAAMTTSAARPHFLFGSDVGARKAHEIAA
jgi:hypothetical protein